jgi:hypothetical protein
MRLPSVLACRQVLVVSIVTLVLLSCAHQQSVAAQNAIVPVSSSGEVTDAEPTVAATPMKYRIFEPEDDWKEIQADEHLPGVSRTQRVSWLDICVIATILRLQGLDIRIDFAAGKKFARNIPKVPKPATEAVAIRPQEAVVVKHGEELVLRPAEDLVAVPATDTDGLDEATARMKDVLLGLPVPEPELNVAIAAGMSKEELTALLHRLWEKRQKELKEAFSSAKTEAHQMHELLHDLLSFQLQGSASNVTQERAIQILVNLEYFVSTLHNAEDFRGMGGLPTIIMLLNHSDIDVSTNAAWVLGSASKYADSVQQVVYENGGVVAAMTLLERSLVDIDAAANVVTFSDGASVAFDNAVLQYQNGVKAASKALYAIGGMLRGHKASAEQFLMLGGEHVLLRSLQSASGAVSVRVPNDAGIPFSKALQGVCVKAGTVLADLFASYDAQAGSSAEASGDAIPIVSVTKIDGKATAEVPSFGAVPAAESRLNKHALCVAALPATRSCMSASRITDTQRDPVIRANDGALSDIADIFASAC